MQMGRKKETIFNRLKTRCRAHSEYDLKRVTHEVALICVENFSASLVKVKSVLAVKQNIKFYQNTQQTLLVTMSDGTWDQIQEIKIKRNSLREKLEKRKKERQDILLGSTNSASASSLIKSESSGSEDKKPVLSNIKHEIGKPVNLFRSTHNFMMRNFLSP